MVSLINFKSFSDLSSTEHLHKTSTTNTTTTSQLQQNLTSFNQPSNANSTRQQQQLEQLNQPPVEAPPYHFVEQQQQQQHATFESKPPLKQNNLKNMLTKKGHFEIRWNNLTYEVEPKWYRQKWRQLRTSSSKSSSSSSSFDSASRSDQESSLSTSTSTSKTRPQLGTTKILENLNGSVKSGQVTAILGPSGAGKTSLLGCLTGKHKSGVSGAVQVLSDRNEPLSICTIPQKDYLLNQLTIRENLWFASRLKHPEDGFDHDSNIERVVDLLKLESCIDTKISKISGGQYKRVSIAQELLSNPDILILDEPTSGLDSLTCYKTVMVLRDLAQLSPNPVAIIVTIHQPQREVFDLFNHVYILAIGGRCIYEGHPCNSIKTINESQSGLHFNADYNPASYLVEIASSEFGEKPIEILVDLQRNDFKRRTTTTVAIEEEEGGYDNNNSLSLPITNLDQQQQQQIISIGTPNLKKRIQSPMVARLKSTLSNFGGGGGNSSSPLSPKKVGGMQQTHQHTYAYTNDAYDTSQVILAGQQQEQQALPGYFELDASQLTHNNNKQQQIDNIKKSNNNNNNNNNINDDDNLVINQANQRRRRRQQQQQQQETIYELPTDLNDHFYLDNRLQTHKHNHQGHFFRHCRLLTKRSWLCLCKDPMLTTLRFAAHIFVPLLITLVYGSRVGKPNACPLYESEMDLIDYARTGSKRLLNLQEELRSTFENVGLYFLSVYAFTFSTMCLTSLSFPLNMHVLLKEVRNGWYSIPTYFIGKTLADFPLEFILPAVTLMITYPLTGQPSSYLEWRFFSATFVFIITSLIAQTQGLIFGALFMNAMQAAVFVAPVSTTPLILLSGFLIRIGQMPIYLQKLSSLSYFRYAIESLTITRYGFGQCPCDPNVVTGQPVTASGVPDQLRTMTNYWLSTFDTGASNGLSAAAAAANGTSEALAATAAAATTLTAVETVTEQPVDFFQDLTLLLARANSFGADIRTCKDLKPYPMIDLDLSDDQLFVWVSALVATLFAFKVINYYVVKYSVKWRL